jgi:hypothetical protein
LTESVKRQVQKVDNFDKDTSPPNPVEWKLLKMIRKLDWGELRIMMQDGKPVRAEEIRSTLLEPDEE